MTIRLSEPMDARLREAARRLRRSRSDLVRLALEAWLEGVPAPGRPGGAAYDLVSDLLGAFESGPRDPVASHRDRVIARVRESRKRWGAS